MFFIISGFVIFWTIEKMATPTDFVISRFSRLYPVYWFFIIFTFTVVHICGLPGREVSLTNAIINLTMVQGAFRIPHVDGVYWTLLVELRFYIIMFLLFRFRLLDRISEFGLLLILIGLFVFLWSCCLGENIIIKIIRTLFLSSYWHLFFAGICFYKQYRNGVSCRETILVLLCAAYSYAVGGREEAIFVSIFFIVFYLMLFGFLKNIVSKPMVILGTISYSLYLVHQNLGYILIRKFYSLNIIPELAILLAVLVSLIVAYAANILIEIPSMLLIRKFYKKIRENQLFRLRLNME